MQNAPSPRYNTELIASLAVAPSLGPSSELSLIFWLSGYPSHHSNKLKSVRLRGRLSPTTPILNQQCRMHYQDVKLNSHAPGVRFRGAPWPNRSSLLLGVDGNTGASFIELDSFFLMGGCLTQTTPPLN